MIQYPIVLLALTALSAFLTNKGLNDPAFFDRMSFKPRRVIENQEFYRIITSGFMHVDWVHFAFNFMTLYAFGDEIENICGVSVFLAIFYSAVIGGNLLSLWMHMHHDYTAVGASGGVCGILYASIFIFDSDIKSFFLPFWIPGYIYAALYIAGSYYALRKQIGNVGHDAHIGGSIVGLFVTVCIYPSIVQKHPYILTMVLLVSFAILYFLYTDPLWIKPWSFGISKRSHGSNIRYQRYDEPSKSGAVEKEVDVLLEKISRKGFASLTEKEKNRLKKLSSDKK